MTRVWVNGAVREAESAFVRADDRGFTLGDGLFETVRLYDGRPFRLAAHLARMRAGAARIGIAWPAEVDTAIARTVAASGVGAGSLRVTLTRGPTAPGLRAPSGASATLVVSVRDHDPREREAEEGVAAIVATGRVNERGAAAGLKHLGYLEAVLAQREAEARGADEAILLNTSGRVAELAAANLFLVRGGAISTPTLSSGALPGITRAAVLELAPTLDLSAGEREIAVEELLAADEAFLTSSLREIVPITGVDDRPVGSGAAGPITRRIRDSYRSLVRRELTDEPPPCDSNEPATDS